MIFKALELTDDYLSVKPAPEIMQIDAISRLFTGKRTIIGDAQGRKGLRGLKELTYMYHAVDPRSPYARYADDKFRRNKVKEAVFADIDWSEDETYMNAENKYKDLILSPSMAVLQAAQIGVAKIRDHFEKVDFTQTDKNGRPIHDPKKIGDMISKLAGMIDSLHQLQEKVQKESEINQTLRGGVVLNKYNE